MIKPKSLLYLYTRPSPFVRKDIEFLSQKYTVKTHEMLIGNPIQGFWLLLKQIFFLLKNVWGCKAIFIMFGGYHAFWPAVFGRVFGKKVFIILGGTDCVSFPSIHYGTFRKPLQSWFTRQGYRMATRLVPVHETLMGRVNDYYEGDPPERGVHYMVKNLKTPHTTIHNGYDPANWDVAGIEKKPRTFISVAAISNASTLVLKGIDLIHEVARAYPDCQFMVVGFRIPADMLEPLPNLELKPFVTSEELRALYSETQFYLQLSISESFPNAICEGMLAECIPIGSRVAGIPEIIGDTGFILDKRDPEMLRGLIQQALAHPDKAALGQQARSRIAREFHISLREQAYLDLVENG